MASGKNSDPLHGHCRCQSHAQKFRPRRGLRFFWIGPEHLPDSLLCGLCAGGKNRIHGGLVISATSLDDGLVTFMGNAAFDLTSLKEKAVPLETLQEGKRKKIPKNLSIQ